MKHQITREFSNNSLLCSKVMSLFGDYRTYLKYLRLKIICIKNHKIGGQAKILRKGKHFNTDSYSVLNIACYNTNLWVICAH